MKCRERLIKTFAALVLGFAALGLIQTGIDDAVTRNAMQRNSLSCIPTNPPAPPSRMFGISDVVQTDAPPLAYLFQILFILFIISPPIIAFMLYLIWKELKDRNKMK
jgi:hypothetical protein